MASLPSFLARSISANVSTSTYLSEFAKKNSRWTAMDLIVSAIPNQSDEMVSDTSE